MILLTGGSGLLGRELKKLHPEIVAPSHKSMDVTYFEDIEKRFLLEKPDMVIHAAGVVGVGSLSHEAIHVNISGTANVAALCQKYHTRMVYISSDYVFDGKRGMYKETDRPNPQTVYGKTKLAGEIATSCVDDHLIIRTSFCENESWKYSRAFVDQFTSRDKVALIAPGVLAASLHAQGIIHIGTERKRLFDLAKSIDPEVLPMKRPKMIPKDVSLDCSRWMGRA